ncbi:Spore germination protein KA [Ruminococcaceae bacterium BL-6]|nr:Spore germination protein KA [Ruminococcaceae bacterium BL-6]
MMWSLLIRKIGFWKQLRRDRKKEDEKGPEQPENQQPADRKVSEKLSDNLDFIKSQLGDSGDVKVHEFRFGENYEFGGALIFIDGLVNMDYITQGIMRPIISFPYSKTPLKKGPGHGIDQISKTVLCSGDIETKQYLGELISGILAGDTIFLADSFQQGLVISTKGWDKRGVTEPETESVVRGPREGFTENFRTNTALIRRKIKSPKLRMEHMTIGRKTQTSVCIAYLDGIANDRVTQQVRSRLKQLDIDSVLDSGYLEEYIEDAPFSIFATVGYSEKPDVIASKILEGRTAILVDGSPFVLTVPFLFVEAFQTAEDYYVRSIYSSIMRLLRFFSYLIAIFAPAIYIALTTFHQELIPTTLLMTIASAREGTPFPAFVEAFVMVLSFEILREAGLRLPRPVGQAVSIVGALVMGDAAVSAGIVGAPMVITVAITAVAGFIIPEQNDTISILRLIMMILSAALGGYGIAMGFLGILIHLGSLQSFGIAYFNAFFPTRDMEDTFIRMPLWAMVKRPTRIAAGDVVRRHFFVPPPKKGQADSQSKGQS